MAKIVKVTEKGKNRELTYPSTMEQVEGLNAALGNKVDKANGKVLSTNDYTTAEKNKLAGIAAGANAYTLPQATASSFGGVKLYTSTGANTDGTMTQSAIKTALDGKTDTHYKATPVISSSTGTSNTTTANVTTYLNIVENGAKSGGVQIKGAGMVTVSGDSGCIAINSDRATAYGAQSCGNANVNLDELKGAGVFVSARFINFPEYSSFPDSGMLINWKSTYPMNFLFQIFADWTIKSGGIPQIWVRTITNVDLSTESKTKWREL